jgi:hypothetical protein
MHAISVDFWDDTLSNLGTFSKINKIAKSEVIRRGTESALLLYGTSALDLRVILIHSLEQNRRILKNPSGNSELRKSLSISASLSAALSSITIVNDGREQAEILRIYTQSIQGHLKVVTSTHSLANEQAEAMDEDLTTYIGILRKLNKNNSQENHADVLRPTIEDPNIIV